MLWRNRRPILNENTDSTDFDAHYVYHTAWAARVLAKIKPKKHVDISSSLYFSTIVSAFVPVEFFDYRPANIKLGNLTSAKADLLSLPFPDDSIESLSCLHVQVHLYTGEGFDCVSW